MELVESTSANRNGIDRGADEFVQIKLTLQVGMEETVVNVLTLCQKNLQTLFHQTYIPPPTLAR